MGVSRADNSIKIRRNLPISNLKPDLHNTNAFTKVSEKPLMFIQFIIRKRNTDRRRMDGRSNISGFEDISMLNFHRDLGATQI